MMTTATTDHNRCPWARRPLEATYHDTEWGVPVADDLLLFEHLTLDSQQAGISWLIILQKRENYRRALADFTPEILANWGERELEGLLQDAGIVRNRAKLAAVLHNARKFLELQQQEGSFAKYLWQWVDGRPVVGNWKSMDQIPAKSELSDAISKDLKKRGFKFVGSVSVYAFLQAVGGGQRSLGELPTPSRSASLVPQWPILQSRLSPGNHRSDELCLDSVSLQNLC